MSWLKSAGLETRDVSTNGWIFAPPPGLFSSIAGDSWASKSNIWRSPTPSAEVAGPSAEYSEMLRVATAKICFSGIRRIASSPSWLVRLTEATSAWGNAERAQRSGARLRTIDRLLAYANGILRAVFLSVGYTSLSVPCSSFTMQILRDRHL